LFEEGDARRVSERLEDLSFKLSHGVRHVGYYIRRFAYSSVVKTREARGVSAAVRRLRTSSRMCGSRSEPCRNPTRTPFILWCSTRRPRRKPASASTGINSCSWGSGHNEIVG
jgi:hypothetical protein